MGSMVLKHTSLIAEVFELETKDGVDFRKITMSMTPPLSVDATRSSIARAL